MSLLQPSKALTQVLIRKHGMNSPDTTMVLPVSPGAMSSKLPSDQPTSPGDSLVV